MLTVVLPKTQEPTVVEMTRSNLQKELNGISGSQLLVSKDWAEGIAKCQTEFICFVEADCLVGSGYFTSLLGLFKKNPYYRQLGIMSSSTAINDWSSRIYGYHLADNYRGGVIPNPAQLSSSPYRLSIAYIPGALIRMSTLKRVLSNSKKRHIIGAPLMQHTADLVYFSTQLSLEFWRHQSHVSISPSSTYVTSEDYVKQTGRFDPGAGDLISFFRQEGL